MNKFIKKIKPPEKWKMPVIIVLGILLGLILYIIKISNAVSYLSDEPSTCVNCHIMAPQYATWSHSSHREVTNCNDCHVPHNNILNKYYFKAKDGIRHATIFTLRAEPQVIQIHQAGINVVQENCKRCHLYLNKEVSSIKATGINSLHGAGKLCWDCHREVPHGRVNSLSSTPNAKAPIPETPVPDWLKKLLNKIK